MSVRLLPSGHRAVVVLLGTAATAAFGTSLWIYFRGPFVSELNSDAAVPVLLAREMLRHRTLLPSTWYYGNGDLWLLSPQLPVLPFVALLGPGARAAALGNAVGLAGCVGVFYALGRSLGASRVLSLVAATGVLSQFSLLQRYFVHGQLAYGWIAATLAVLLAVSVRAHFTATRRLPWLALAALLAGCIAASNPLRAAVFWLVPVVATSLLAARGQRSVNLAAWNLGGFVLGTAIHQLLEQRLHVDRGLPSASALGGLRHAWTTIRAGVPLLLGHRDAHGLDRLGSVLRASFAILGLLALTGAWFSRQPPGPSTWAARLVAVQVSCVGGSFLLARLGADTFSLRYFLPSLLLGLVVLLCLLSERLWTHARVTLAVLGVFVLAFVGGGLAAALTVARQLPPRCLGETRACALVKALASNGLPRGFASYWRAGAVTLATRGAVEVCPVEVSAAIAPRRWLTTEDCWDPERSRGGYFLVLAEEERTQLDLRSLERRLGPPARTLSVGSLDIAVYPAGTPLPWTSP